MYRHIRSRRARLLAAFFAALLLASFVAGTASAQSGVGINLAYRDTTCAPCQKFYEYANGGWIRSVSPLTSDALGTLEELNLRRERALTAILDSLRATRVPDGTAEWKLQQFYESCMDVPTLESLGTTVLEPEITRIEAIASLPDVEREIVRLHRRLIAPLFILQALPDARDSRHVVADLMPFGRGLEDHAAYAATDSASIATRQRYVIQVARTLELSGMKPADASARAPRVVALEGRLAGWSLSMMDRMDPAALSHPMTVRALDSLTPGWSWAVYFREMGIRGVTVVNVEEPAYFKAFGAALGTIPIDDLKSYIRWRYASAASLRLGGHRVDSLLGDYGRGHLRQESVAARKSSCVDETEQRLGWLLGRFYARSAFTPASRARANAMVGNIRSVLRSELDTLSWISASARREAVRKLDAFVVQMGYPDRWPDYSGVVVRPKQFLENVLMANEYQTTLDLSKIGRAQNVNDWWSGYWPQTNDAFFNPNLNEVVIAGGNLQPPMFDPTADDAFNYGAIGSMIAHEMTHAFDERGRKFDASANLRDWWTQKDEVAFAARAKRAVVQYDSYLVIDTMHINGRQTLSENLADIGGLQLSFAALERSLAHGRRETVDGLTPEQRFFIAYAQSRRGLFNASYLRDKVLHDNHSPGKWRVIGPIVNMPEFARAFRCKSGDPMVAPDAARVRVW